MTENPQQPPSEVRDAALSTLTHWVAAIADRVNNPVASVLAGLAVIQREIETPSSGAAINKEQIGRALERIKGRLSALAEYVQELQNFGHPDRFLPVGVALSTAVATVMVEFESRGETAGELEADLGAPMVFADYSRLKVALRSLFMNGWEAAARSERALVKVSSREVQGGVEIVVEDTGPGFSATALAHLGEPFFSTKEAGTGLGLAIVKKFVASHGGTFACGTSARLGGAMVTLFLPVKRLEDKS